MSFELNSQYNFALFDKFISDVEKLKNGAKSIIDICSNMIEPVIRLIERDKHLTNQIQDREDEIRSLLELKHEFLRNVTHELRTPLTGIMSLSQTLSENYSKLNEKQRYEAINMIAESTERFEDYVNNILDLSNLSNNIQNLNVSEIDLSSLVHGRVQHCKKLFLGDKDISFELDVEPDVKAFCDAYYIMQSIDNLIINAIKYSNSGTIIVSLKKQRYTASYTINDIDGNEIIFSVTDEGVGIPPLELFDIFEPFTVSSKTRTPAGGRGVGLALVKKVAEAHNGRVWAESEGTKGTKFYFAIPMIVSSSIIKKQLKTTIPKAYILDKYINEKLYEEKVDIARKLLLISFDKDAVANATGLSQAKLSELLKK